MSGLSIYLYILGGIVWLIISMAVAGSFIKTMTEQYTTREQMTGINFIGVMIFIIILLIPIIFL